MSEALSREEFEWHLATFHKRCPSASIRSHDAAQREQWEALHAALLKRQDEDCQCDREDCLGMCVAGTCGCEHPSCQLAATQVERDNLQSLYSLALECIEGNGERERRLWETLEHIAEGPCLAEQIGAKEDGLHSPCPSCVARQVIKTVRDAE